MSLSGDQMRSLSLEMDYACWKDIFGFLLHKLPLCSQLKVNRSGLFCFYWLLIYLSVVEFVFCQEAFWLYVCLINSANKTLPTKRSIITEAQVTIFSFLNTPLLIEDHFVKVNLTNGYKQERAVVAIFSEATCNFFNLFHQKLKIFNHSPIYLIVSNRNFFYLICHDYLLNRSYKYSWETLKINP